MNLIEETVIQNTKIKFYEGFDLSVILNHPKDGSDGMIYCFFNNWGNEIKINQRNKKIEFLLEGKSIENLNMEDINNNYVILYQIGGLNIEIYRTIKQRLELWTPVAGCNIALIENRNL